MRPHRRVHPGYSHGLLVHHDDDELVEGTLTFVEQGLASGGKVVVRGTRNQVGLMRQVIGTRPQLEYGFNEELYTTPTRALFAYQRLMEEGAGSTTFSVTGPVPLGNGSAARGAWARYESAVNEALSCYPYRALCTYDTQTRPSSVIAAARATHPTISTDQKSRTNPEYVEPEAFLAEEMAQVPTAPSAPPSTATTVTQQDHLVAARHLLRTSARQSSAASQHTINEFLLAVTEVVLNGLVHGAPPVYLTLWADLDTLTCQVVDSGPGTLHPLTGYRYPDESSPKGLWMARQLVDDLIIGNPSGGGCSVLLTRARTLQRHHS
ncbi:MAG: MEDS domain-containing protein [Mycobacteriaceae bacterium]